MRLDPNSKASFIVHQIKKWAPSAIKNVSYWTAITIAIVVVFSPTGHFAMIYGPNEDQMEVQTVHPSWSTHGWFEILFLETLIGFVSAVFAIITFSIIPLFVALIHELFLSWLKYQLIEISERARFNIEEQSLPASNDAKRSLFETVAKSYDVWFPLATVRRFIVIFLSVTFAVSTLIVIYFMFTYSVGIWLFDSILDQGREGHEIAAAALCMLLQFLLIGGSAILYFCLIDECAKDWNKHKIAQISSTSKK